MTSGDSKTCKICGNSMIDKHKCFKWFGYVQNVAYLNS